MERATADLVALDFGLEALDRGERASCSAAAQGPAGAGDFADDG